MVTIDTSDFVRSIKNVAGYTDGFVTATIEERLMFNIKLGTIIVSMLYAYIDSKAKLEPESLHHVYEPQMLGDPDGRLFELGMEATAAGIVITGGFLRSAVSADERFDPFYERARIMESGISISIEPQDGGVLSFMDDGELVTISTGVFVEHPGGPEVEGSFGRAVDTFLSTYLIKGIIDPIIKKLSTPEEYANSLVEGSRSGRSAGLAAGKKYMNGALHELI